MLAVLNTSKHMMNVVPRFLNLILAVKSIRYTTV